MNLLHGLFPFLLLLHAVGANDSPVPHAQHVERQSDSFNRIGLTRMFQTCLSIQQSEIQIALRNMHNFTLPVRSDFFRFNFNDADWTLFFGSGWDRNLNIKETAEEVLANISKMAALFETSGDKLIEIECGGPSICTSGKAGQCLPPVSFDTEVQSIVVCPLVSQFKHTTEFVKQGPLEGVFNVRTWESVLFHEFMHLDNMGYKTPINSIPFFNTVNQNHSACSVEDAADTCVGDLKALLPVTTISAGRLVRTSATIPVYGATKCAQLAALQTSSTPILEAAINADSYTSFMTFKFFSSQAGGRNNLKDRAGTDTVDSSSAEEDQLFDNPRQVCTDLAQPLAAHCALIDVVSDTNFINLGSTCGASGSRKWCDVYSFETCQISIGWDTNELGDVGPSVSNSDVAGFVNDAHIGRDGCSPFFLNHPGVCSTIGNICSKSFVMCMKTDRQDCRPGVNPDGTIRGPSAKIPLNPVFSGNTNPGALNNFTGNSTKLAARGNNIDGYL